MCDGVRRMYGNFLRWSMRQRSVWNSSNLNSDVVFLLEFCDRWNLFAKMLGIDEEDEYPDITCILVAVVENRCDSLQCDEFDEMSEPAAVCIESEQKRKRWNLWMMMISV